MFKLKVNLQRNVRKVVWLAKRLFEQVVERTGVVRLQHSAEPSPNGGPAVEIITSHRLSKRWDFCYCRGGQL